MWKYRVDQHLIVLNVYSISIKKNLLTQFRSVKKKKKSQNLNSMQKIPTQ